jgi:uncharacterized delta-60 repeat protein
VTGGSNYALFETVALRPDGRIVAGGYHDGPALYQYRADGTPDDGFGTGGAIRPIPQLHYSVSALTIEPDGQIVALGRARTVLQATHLALARFQSDGQPDIGFGMDGVATTSVGVGQADGLALALLPGGEIIVAGTAKVGGSADVAVARYFGQTTVPTEPAPPSGALALEADPNPVVGSTMVSLVVPSEGMARLVLLDVLGRVVAVLHDGPLTAGPHVATLDALPLAPGVYVLRLATGGVVAVRRLTVAR